jgi:aspartyl-tRNA(Asn)/glutamyl-tRNA(Gln) amidotransferase subunit B
MPWEITRRLEEHYELPAYDAAILSDQRTVAMYFEACVAAGADAKLASNWVMTEVLRVLKERSWEMDEWSARVPAARLAELVRGVGEKTIPGPVAKQAFAWMVDEAGDLGALLERHGVSVRSSADDLAPLVRAVIDENPGPVTQYLNGKTATLGFLVGQVMKKSGGQAVPQVVQELLKAELAARAPSR